MDSKKVIWQKKIQQLEIFCLNNFLLPNPCTKFILPCTEDRFDSVKGDSAIENSTAGEYPVAELFWPNICKTKNAVCPEIL